MQPESCFLAPEASPLPCHSREWEGPTTLALGCPLPAVPHLPTTSQPAGARGRLGCLFLPTPTPTSHMLHTLPSVLCKLRDEAPNSARCPPLALGLLGQGKGGSRVPALRGPSRPLPLRPPNWSALGRTLAAAPPTPTEPRQSLCGQFLGSPRPGALPASFCRAASQT